MPHLTALFLTVITGKATFGINLEASKALDLPGPGQEGTTKFLLPFSKLTFI